MSPLEIAANLMVAASILLAGRNSVHTWWTGLLGCGLFALLFYRVKLYADVSLQLFFIASCVLGWWRWQRGGQQHSTLPVRHAQRPTLLLSLAAGALVTAGYGALLHRHTDAYAPFLDSAVLAFSVVAQCLMMQRQVENWPFWLLVNSLAVPLYFSRELYLTAALYAAYWVNAGIAWRHWAQLASRPPEQPREQPA